MVLALAEVVCLTVSCAIAWFYTLPHEIQWLFSVCACTIIATDCNVPDDLKKGCCDLYTIQLDENGCTHTNDYYGFSITFPPGSLLSNQIITLTIGVMTHGPFLFPENVVPISATLLVCGNSSDVKLLKNAKIVLQHCLDIEKSDNRGIEILFMKAHVNHYCIGKRRYIFESMSNAATLEDHKAALFTSHFCCICLATKMTDSLKERMQYCITLFQDKANSTCVFFVTYLLEACIQVNNMQSLELVLHCFFFMHAQSLKEWCRKNMDCNSSQKYDFKWNGSSVLKIQYPDVPGWQLTLVKGGEGVSNL